ncbi:MAG: glutamate-5-semialdehyde dehydrogenase [Clostridiales bacterium]|nr:glutamate-5-semialdehyde dehydrogenase [Clostridiales bacterium]
MVDVYTLCKKAKLASNKFSSCTKDEKNFLLGKIKEAIIDNVDAIKEANSLDLKNAEEAKIKGAFLDRLTLTDARIQTMLDGIDDVIALPDYVGMVEKEEILKNGILLKKVRAPLGVVGIIYESRPNVTVDAAILCIKSGNAVVLKGGKEAINTNRLLTQIMKNAFKENGFNPDLIAFIDGIDRELTHQMLLMGDFIDVVIPRGGEKLKKYVLGAATMPVIASSGGNCHIFVEKSASLDMAVSVIENAKVSRPSVCNALETILIERAVAKEFLPKILDNLSQKGVEIRGTREVKDIYNSTVIVDGEEFFTEYEDLIVKVKVVEDIEEAIFHINNYGTGHSDGIITNNANKAEQFSKEVDSSAVYVNVSTRFTDGYEFGLGAEMAISTQKLHVRGPIGLQELTSLKYVLSGNGQIR